jgi:hypothetical protein
MRLPKNGNNNTSPMRNLALTYILTAALIGNVSADEAPPKVKSPDEKKPTARLTVSASVMFPKLVTTPKDFTAKTLYMCVAARLYIENCGATPITIPTRMAPDGKPTGESWTHDTEGDSRRVFFHAEYPTRGGKKIQPSPVAFEPVTLQPGEQALVGKWDPQEGYRDTLPGELRNVTFTYGVPEDLAARFGWWSGELEVKVDFIETHEKFRGDHSWTEATGKSR